MLTPSQAFTLPGAELRIGFLSLLCGQNLCVVCVATYGVNAALFKLSLADYKAVVASLRAGLSCLSLIVSHAHHHQRC